MTNYTPTRPQTSNSSDLENTPAPPHYPPFGTHESLPNSPIPDIANDEVIQFPSRPTSPHSKRPYDPWCDPESRLSLLNKAQWNAWVKSTGLSLEHAEAIASLSFNLTPKEFAERCSKDDFNIDDSHMDDEQKQKLKETLKVIEFVKNEEKRDELAKGLKEMEEVMGALRREKYQKRMAELISPHFIPTYKEPPQDEGPEEAGEDEGEDEAE